MKRRRWRLSHVLPVLGLVFLAAIVVGGYWADRSQRREASQAGGPMVRLASWSGGGRIALSSPRKPTVVFAMAGWCATCLPVAEQLADLHQELAGSAQIVALSVDPGETEASLRRFWEAAGKPPYLWGFDEGGRATVSLRITYLDTVIVLDSEGKELYRAVRPSNEELLAVLRAVQ